MSIARTRSRPFSTVILCELAFIPLYACTTLVTFSRYDLSNPPSLPPTLSPYHHQHQTQIDLLVQPILRTRTRTRTHSRDVSELTFGMLMSISGIDTIAHEYLRMFLRLRASKYVFIYVIRPRPFCLSPLAEERKENYRCKPMFPFIFFSILYSLTPGNFLNITAGHFFVFLIQRQV